MDFGPKEIGRILEVTDRLGIHREAVTIPLMPEGEGSVRIVGNRLEIHRPLDGDLEAWLDGLEAEIGALDLSPLKRIE